MSLAEILYTAAYCIFLIGASKSFRDNGSASSLRIMSAGVLIDFLTSMLPMLGVTALKMNEQGTNAAILFGIALGFVVWLLFAAAVVMRKKGRQELYHGLITITEILWFVDFIAFLYGLYAVPLKGASS